MTALAKSLKTATQMGATAAPDLLSIGAEASTTLYAGGMCGVDSSGYAVPASSTATQKVAGRIENDVNNSAGAAGAVQVPVRRGVFFYACPDSSITISNYGAYCYVVDDNNVSLNDGGGLRPIAGTIMGVGASGTPESGKIAVGLGLASPYGTTLSAPSTVNRVRAVVTLLSGAYTGSGTGTLTASSAAAFGTQDGVSTLAAGDLVLLPAGITNITAAKDAGPYVISVLGTGSVKWVLTRPDWWATGSTIPLGASIDVGGGGTLFSGTSWKSFVVTGKVVDTDDPLFYPRQVTQQITLLTGGGNVAVTNVPIYSATRSQVVVSYAGSGTPNAATLGYQPGAITPGALNTATVTVQAVKAAMVAQATDTSVLNCTIFNG